MDIKTQNNPHKKKCSILDRMECGETIRKKQDTIFVSHPFGNDFPVDDFRSTLIEVGEKEGVKFQFADEIITPGPILCKICKMIQESCISIFDVTNWNPNVTLELGLAYGLGERPIIFFSGPTKGKFLSDIAGQGRAQYESFTQLRQLITSHVIPHIPSLAEKHPFIVLSQEVEIEFKEYENDERYQRSFWIFRHHIKITRSGEWDFAFLVGTEGEFKEIESLSHDKNDFNIEQRPDGYHYMLCTNLGNLPKGEEVIVVTRTNRITPIGIIDPNKYVEYQSKTISEGEDWVGPIVLYPTNKIKYKIRFSPKRTPSQYIETLKLIGTSWFKDEMVEETITKSHRILEWEKHHPEPNVRYMIKWRW